MTVAVISLDFINDIVHKDGKIARSAPLVAERHCLSHANAMLHWARQRGHVVIHVKVGFTPTYTECPTHSPIFGAAKQHGALILGTWGTDFHADLSVEASDVIVTKHRISAFYGTELDVILRTQNIEEVVLMGVSTNMAVEATARDAHDRDYRVTVIEDACAAPDQTCHEVALLNLARLASVTPHHAFLQNKS